MNSRQSRTLKAVFTTPAPSGIEWDAIESLLLAVGCQLIEGNGSRVRFLCKNLVATFHRPHPDKEAKRYQVRDAREFLTKIRNEAMSVLRYRGYLARVEYDVDDRILTGRIAGINDVIGFHGKTGDDLEVAFHEAVDDYIETCRKADKAPERPFGGKVMFRVKPDVHARAALAAQLRGVSLNQWAEEALDQKADADLVNCR